MAVKDWTPHCECGAGGTAQPKCYAIDEMKKHIRSRYPTCREAFIDEYDPKGGDNGSGELTGRYLKLTFNGSIFIEISTD